MELEVADRVHITPIGYEVDRVVEPCERLKASTVVIVEYEKHEEKGRSYCDRIVSRLEDQNIGVSVVESDIFDFYEFLGIIGEQVSHFENDDVFVNLSTGSKVTAIAGMVGCMMTNATPYYAKAHNYETETPSDIGEIIRLPEYPIEPPEVEEIEVLNFLKKKRQVGEQVTKGDIIDFSEGKNLSFVADNDVQEKGKYRLLDAYIVNPLTEKKYVNVAKSGRNKIVEISKEGENALRAFSYLINSR